MPGNTLQYYAGAGPNHVLRALVVWQVNHSAQCTDTKQNPSLSSNENVQIKYCKISLLLIWSTRLKQSSVMSWFAPGLDESTKRCLSSHPPLGPPLYSMQRLLFWVSFSHRAPRRCFLGHLLLQLQWWFVDFSRAELFLDSFIFVKRTSVLYQEIGCSISLVKQVTSFLALLKARASLSLKPSSCCPSTSVSDTLFDFLSPFDDVTLI